MMAAKPLSVLRCESQAIRSPLRGKNAKIDLGTIGEKRLSKTIQNANDWFVFITSRWCIQSTLIDQVYVYRTLRNSSSKNGGNNASA